MFRNLRHFLQKWLGLILRMVLIGRVRFNEVPLYIKMCTKKIQENNKILKSLFKQKGALPKTRKRKAEKRKKKAEILRKSYKKL